MLFRQIGDWWGLCGPLMYLAEIQNNEGAYAEARTLGSEALSIVRKTGEKWRTAACLDTLGEIALAEGDYGRALSLFEESLAMCQEAHNNRRIAHELRNLGRAHRLTGAIEEARHHYRESLGLYVGLAAKPGIANLLDSLACVAATKSQAVRASRLFGQAEALREGISARMPAHERGDHASNVEVCRASLGEHVFAAAWAEGRAMTMEQAIDFALDAEPT